MGKIKALLDKTVSNQKFIETRRKHVNFGVGEAQKIQAWEAQVGRDGTPLLAYYKNWKKISDIQHAKKVSNQGKLDDYSHIPALKKNHKKIRMKMEQSEEATGFLSGSDDDFDDEENFKLKEERGMKRKNSGGSEEESPKRAKKSDEQYEEEDDQVDDGGQDDEVEDLKLEDLDSDLDMEDDFGAGSDAGEDDTDQEEDSDDESDEN